MWLLWIVIKSSKRKIDWTASRVCGTFLARSRWGWCTRERARNSVYEMDSSPKEGRGVFAISGSAEGSSAHHTCIECRDWVYRGRTISRTSDSVVRLLNKKTLISNMLQRKKEMHGLERVAQTGLNQKYSMCHQPGLHGTVISCHKSMQNIALSAANGLPDYLPSQKTLSRISLIFIPLEALNNADYRSRNIKTHGNQKWHESTMTLWRSADARLLRNRIGKPIMCAWD